jgi:hypothetical protein
VKCEEFGCLPAAGGLDTQPWGLLEEIHTLRTYARARDEIERQADSARRGGNYEAPAWVHGVYGPVKALALRWEGIDA